MLRISDFSKLSGASVKALRYYDQLELLTPAFVDQQSGYRYYSEEQLLTVKRIVSFKEQGFTLEQIKTFLEDQIPLTVVKDQLMEKQNELLQTIALAQQQFAEVSERLNRVEQRHVEEPLLNQVTVRCIQPQLAATIRAVVPRTQLCVLLEEVTKYVQSHGETGNRSLMILWHDYGNAEVGKSEQVDLEVALPLSRVIPDTDRVNVRYLPQIDTAASLLHECDPYESECPAIDDVLDWMISNGFTPSDSEPIRETYLTTDHDMYGRMRRSEVLVPISANARITTS